MSWEQRLRDLVLAGGAGALAAIGCVDGAVAGGDSGADGNPGPGVNFCCNANPDPCCRSQHCGDPVTEQCTVKMACEADGGGWDPITQGCSRPEDSGAADGPSDAVATPDVVGIFCCNANPDPCCPSLHCGAPETVQCTDKMACESGGGVWNYGTGCSRPLDSGPRDASSDAP